MHRRAIVVSLLSFGIISAFASSAEAQTAYVSAIDGTNTRRLGILNLATGSFQSIGTLPFSFFGMATIGGTLYGVHEGGGLYSINTSNANVTFIRQIDNTNGGLPVPGSLTVGNTGTVYNLQNPTIASASNAYIYTVNIAGASTSVSPLSTVGGGTGNTGIIGDGGLAYDNASGLLYATQGSRGNGVFTVNPSTGAVTTLTSNAGFGATESAYSLFSDAATGTMYSVGYPSGSTGSIWTINKNTGAATTVATYNAATIGAIETGTFIAAAAPEPGTGVLALLTLVPAVIGLRRKN